MSIQSCAKATDFKRAISDLLARTRPRERAAVVPTPPSTAATTPATLVTPSALSASPSPFAFVTPATSMPPSTSLSTDGGDSGPPHFLSAALRRLQPPSMEQQPMETEAEPADRLIEVIPNRSAAVVDSTVAVVDAAAAATDSVGACREQLTRLRELAESDPRDYYGLANQELADMSSKLQAAERRMAEMNAEALDLLLVLANSLDPACLQPAMDGVAECRACARAADELAVKSGGGGGNGSTA